MLGLRGHACFSPAAVLRLLTAVASLVAEDQLLGTQASAAVAAGLWSTGSIVRRTGFAAPWHAGFS